MNIIKNTVTISILTASSLLAATPNIGDVLKEVKSPKDLSSKKTAPLVEVGGVKKYAPVMIDDKSGKSILVKTIQIEGATKIPLSELEALVASYTNKKLTFNQIQEVTSIITKEYRSQGYFVARAYIPVQKMQNGNIKIAIIEGNYGKFNLKNNSRVKNSIVQGMLDEAKSDKVISTNTLERAMLIINDTAGVVVTSADVMPGAEIGSSDFAIASEASAAYDGYIIADNQGSRYTGKNRLMAGINLNSPFEIGDKLSLSGLISNGENLKNGRASYSFPVMSNGMNLELSYSNTTYTLADKYDSLEARGNSKNLDVTLKYPIIRTRLENLNTTLGFTKKSLKDEVRSTSDVTEKDANVMNFGFDYDKNHSFFGFDSQTNASITYTLGRLVFADESKRTSDEAGANTNGSYSKVAFTLGKTIALSEKSTIESSFKYQHSLGNKNLDGSEDFSIGGSTGVKVYPDGELSAENGYVFNIEAKYRVLNNYHGLSSQLGVFYDRGKAYMAENNVGFESKSLQDIGIGSYSNYKDFFAQVQAAWTVNSESVTSEPTRNSRVLFQGGWKF